MGMQFMGRLVPMATMNMIFALWVFAVIFIGVIVFWFGRRRPPRHRNEKVAAGRRRGKRAGRRRN